MKNEFDKSTVGYYLSLTFGAGIAQLVEHYLAKVAVASSSLVARSIFLFKMQECLRALGPFFGLRQVDICLRRQHYCESRRRHSQVAKATVCKIVIPSSTLGAASRAYFFERSFRSVVQTFSVNLFLPSLETVFVFFAGLSEYSGLRDIPCRDGEIGRRKGLKIPRNVVPCRFDSGSRHHPTLLMARR